MDVQTTSELVQQGASDKLSSQDAKDLRSQPATITDALPLIPEVARSPDGDS
jgi:hypothetical protein